MYSDHTAISRDWTDDYLDLLNYAKQIGDPAWQAEIEQKLRDKNQHIAQVTDYKIQQQLWAKFDEINRKMLELYIQIHASKNTSEECSIMDQILELKLQRIRIGQELKRS